MGEILIGGMASLLICIFLGPRFIEELREREFGQHIREEGPEGHHEKAGTPTMGGLVLFLAVAVPFLILSDYRAVSLAVFATAARHGWAGVRRRLDKIRKRRSLGLSGRTKLVGAGADLDRAVAGSRPSTWASRTPCACGSWTRPWTSATSTRC